jgi:hypothetical protein
MRVKHARMKATSLVLWVGLTTGAFASFGCGGGDSSTTGGTASGSNAPKSSGTPAASTAAKSATPPAKPESKGPELKSVEDKKIGYKVSVPKDAEAKTDDPNFHTYNLGMPVDYSVAIQVMTDADPTFKTADEFAKHEKGRIGSDPISTKELGKDRFLVVFPDKGLHGDKVEANLWMMAGKKKFWVRCSSMKDSEQLATDMCTSFTPN